MASVEFRPTHRITFRRPGGKQQVFTVMLVDGAAYTRQEWQNETAADWERSGGRWLFQGQATPGGANGTVTVKAVTKSASRAPKASGGVIATLTKLSKARVAR